ncbi:hypothetical protein GE061_004896 [Apolygus lucorum]|uniref:WD repeat-containing protein 55 homolog n=1 Tax=Apolygus lucorum TaxID=248454 RepID=A0A8S9WUS0_APOLU|nr:hypothetical protein GE061_004896 [Apolygus lucorum]
MPLLLKRELRGVKRCVNIFGLAFSPDAAFLAAASNTETVHVFKLDDPKEVPPATASGEEGRAGGLVVGWGTSAKLFVWAPTTFPPK